MMASAFHKYCQPDAFLNIGYSYHRQNWHHVFFHHRNMVGFYLIDNQLDIFRSLDAQGLKNAAGVFAYPVTVEFAFLGGEQSGQAIDILRLS